MKVTLPETPFTLPPVRPDPIAPSLTARIAERIDPVLMVDESEDHIPLLEDEGVPMGKRKDWVTPPSEL